MEVFEAYKQTKKKIKKRGKKSKSEKTMFLLVTEKVLTNEVLRVK